MVRAPAKSCPNLSRLFDDAEPSMIAAFLRMRVFDKLTWLADYHFEPDGADGDVPAAAMLREQQKDNLSSLETEAARIFTVSSDRGEFALDGLVRTKLAPERKHEFDIQRDSLARSFWAYLNEPMLFEAAENTLHLRLYRRYDRHYQTFMVEPDEGVSTDVEASALKGMLDDLRTRLDRGDGYEVDRFEIPAEGEEPTEVMYLVIHPERPASFRELHDDGQRTTTYFRPPGEIMIVHSPATGRVHVRAGTRRLRHDAAESFITKILEQELSSQPIDFQAYDIARFFHGFDLELPEFDDVSILRARVIRVDISIGNLANRLSVSTSLDEDIGQLISDQPGLERIFRNALAIRFVEIAVQYRRGGVDGERTLDFTLTDRNTTSLLSLHDPFERVLGHRLLRHWGILRDGRAPTPRESMAVLPALLALWNLGSDRINGAWLHERGVDVKTLLDLGFLVPSGWEGDDLIDDEDDFAEHVAKVVERPEGLELYSTDGQSSSAALPERYRVYRIRDGWVASHLREQLGKALDIAAMENIRPDLIALGDLEIDGSDVPLYLARRLEDERVRAAIDTELRARDKQGIGLVLQAGDAAGSCVAANVLARLADHILLEATEIAVDMTSLISAFRRNRSLAQGGAAVEFHKSGNGAGVLSVPGKGTIDIVGAQRVMVIDRLVQAYPTPMKTDDMVAGIGNQSLGNIFGQSLWSKLKADFLRSPKRGLWEIAT
ncbi:hypothetical protein PE067_00355 [Paracoccus sp. DMF-8]|uniref:hypothetical protein n=1 Tax=Paracoccus sp. DMF-8 TaxID=3019445 RepID=UPI0023E86320|nr:hypothetical protein [Paracoccus sp. DMF-8]MDF3604741.1 hypothetical protein [Paracoccus sp. DMF-8]